MMEENPKWPWKSGNICSNYLRFLAKVTFPTIQLATITKLSYFTILSNIYYQCRDGANAIPGYQKLHARVIHIRNNRRGQLSRGAMTKPHSGGTAFVITVDLYAR